jgi:NarL family two-component system response regulator LiaR
MSDSIRVILVDDHDIVRSGLAVLLETFGDIDLVGQAANGLDAIALIEKTQPSVVLMDLIMPKMDGVEATRRIRAAFPDVKVVILTSIEEEGAVQEALRAGAIGYMMKNSSVTEVVAAIRSAHEGRFSLSPAATQALISATTRPTTPALPALTDREREILALMVEGQTNQQIAITLNISLSTVKFHVSSILSKLNVESRTEAVAVAVQNHLVN